MDICVHSVARILSNTVVLNRFYLLSCDSSLSTLQTSSKLWMSKSRQLFLFRLAFLPFLPLVSSPPSFLPPFPSQTQYLTLPKSPSPVNLPVHYTPAISASPLRQVQLTVTAHLCFISHLSSTDLPSSYTIFQ